MIRVGVVLTVVLVAVNGALIGSSKCTWGPSYWCQSFKNANECGSTSHCLEKAWLPTNPKVEVEDSEWCTICKDMVSDVKNFVEANQTRSTILGYLNRACDFMPDAYARKECMGVEQHYVDEFLQCVQKEVDPNEICRLAMLCQAKVPAKQDLQAQALVPAKLVRVPLAKNNAPLKAKDSTICEVCKDVMDLVNNEIKDPNVQNEVKSLLDNECKSLGGSLGDECQSVVNLLLPELFSFLQQELNENLCVTMSLCSNNSTVDVKAELRARFVQWLKKSNFVKTVKGVSTRANNQLCDTCEMVLGYAKIFLANNNTQQEVEQLLENDVCTQLGEFADICDNLVKDYLPQLYAKLLEVLDPATLCAEVGLCQSQIQSVMQPLIPETPQPKKENVQAGPQCILCEFVMSKVEDTLSDNATEEEIIQTIEKVCTILPQSIRTECDDLIEQYGKTIIQLLLNEAKPSVICGFLGLCTSAEANYNVGLSADNCMMCELAMSYVQSTLKKNSTDQEIVQTVEKVCNFLSGAIAQECDSMVEQYAPMIIQMVVNDLQPAQICKALGMCKSGMKVDGRVHLFNRANNV